MSLRPFARKHEALVLSIVDDILAQKPGYGDTINRTEIAKRLGKDPQDQIYLLAFHAARDELIERTPSLCFKVKKGTNKCEYVRATEEERARIVMRYLKKSHEAAYRGVRRSVRTTLPESAPPDVKREHERRLVQASNILHDTKTHMRRTEQGRWLGMVEATPDPRPVLRPGPSPQKPKGSRWLHHQADDDKKDDQGPSAPAEAPK